LTASLCPAGGVTAPVLFAGRLYEGITVLAALGYDAAELSLRDPAEVDVERLRAALAAAGLAVSSISSGRAFVEDGLSLASPDPAIRQAIGQRLAAYLELAAQLGSAVTISGIRGRLPREDRANEVRRATGRALHDLAQVAQALGVQLLLEPLNRYEINYVNTVAEARQLIADAELEGIKILLDLFHMNIEEVSLAQAVIEAGPLVGYVHFADSNRRAPASGHTDFAPVLAALLQVGYRGYLGMEILPLPDDATAARLGVENTRRLVEAALTADRARRTEQAQLGGHN